MRNSFPFGWTTLFCLLATTSGQQKPGECEEPCPSCPEEARCQDGIPRVPDGCGCCFICARQHGQRCDDVNVCDVTKQLVCDVTGTCRGSNFRNCVVNGTSYHDGETFFTDCRTRCTCQDGSYACTSLCPHEMIRPSRSCRDPVLSEVRGQCCRQWTCTGDPPASPPPCEPLTSEWSPCSATCGAGVSTRITNRNRDCTLLEESRLCQIRECPRNSDTWRETLYRMVREDDKVCHPSHRSPNVVHLHWQNCTSVHRYRPPFCSLCHRRCCRPAATFTRSLPFLCDLDQQPSGVDHLWRLGNDAGPHFRPGKRVVKVSQKVMWLKNCVCVSCEKEQEDLSNDESSENGQIFGHVLGDDKEGFKSQLMGGDIDGDEPL